MIFVIYTTYTAQPDIRYIDRALDLTITNHISPDQKVLNVYLFQISKILNIYVFIHINVIKLIHLRDLDWSN